MPGEEQTTVDSLQQATAIGFLAAGREGAPEPSEGDPFVRKLVPVTERGEAAAEGMAKAIPSAIERHLRHQLDAKVGETGADADVPKPVADEEFRIELPPVC